MNEKEVIQRLARDRDHIQRYEVMVPNCYTTHDNEADFFGIRKSGFCDEFEVKVTRSDFRADAKKRVWYRESTPDDWGWKQKGMEFAPYTKPKHEALACGETSINYFWYAVIEGVCEVEEVPEFAGLILIREKGPFRVLKSPVRLHSRKLSMEERYQYARKNGYRFWKLFLEEAA